MNTENIIKPGAEVQVLNHVELIEISGGADAAEGSYAAGYSVGRWFNQMYHIWHYGLTHLSDH